MIHRLAIFLVILAMAVCCLAEAADQPQRQLDGNQPADALQILTILAAQAPLKLDESEQRRAAILTLQAVVQRDAVAQAKAEADAKAKAAEPKLTIDTTPTVPAKKD